MLEIRNEKRSRSLAPFFVATLIFLSPQLVAGAERLAVSLLEAPDRDAAARDDVKDVAARPPRLDELFVFGDMGPPADAQPTAVSPALQAAIDAAVRESRASPLNAHHAVAAGPR